MWTTGSWLLYEYLEQASAADRKTMEEAIARGDIAWHALPFTWQTEMMSPSLIEGSLAFSRDLDRRFGKITTGAKMTDVPGHTRGLIAPLAKHKVGFLEIGVNGGSTVARLPPIFLWKSPSGASLPVMYHWDYSGTAKIPGSQTVLATRVRDDNSGPHTAEEITHLHAALAAQFPHAEIVACNLSEMAEAIAPHRRKLPIVTQEIGDTWIHGVGTDPLKVARYRELARLRDAWITAGKFKTGDATDVALLRRMLLEIEHTWGTDTKTWLDFDHYTPHDLAPMLDTKNYKVVQFSWQEKRQELFTAVASLPVPLREQALTAVRNLAAVEPQLAHTSLHLHETAIETEHFVVGIEPKTGAISRLLNKKSKREWASSEHLLALFSYQTLSQQDYTGFFKSYVISEEDWAKKDFGKPNIERFGAESRDWLPSVADLQLKEDQQGHRLLVRLQVNDAEALRSGRASFPQNMYLEMLLPKAEPVIHLNFSWFKKPATRMPEALWLSFNPIASNPSGWMLEKSGEPVSPWDVVRSGNRHMHALSKGFGYEDQSGAFFVETLDAPLVAMGVKSPLYFSTSQPDLSAGIHCNLFNNAWGTNYIMWFGEDMRFRFLLRA